MPAVLSRPAVKEDPFQVLSLNFTVEIPQIFRPTQLTGIWDVRGKGSRILQRPIRFSCGPRMMRSFRIQEEMPTRKIEEYCEEHHTGWQFAGIGEMYGCSRHHLVGHEMKVDVPVVFFGSPGDNEDRRSEEDKTRLIPCLRLRSPKQGMPILWFEEDTPDRKWEVGTQFVLTCDP